jgi:hypothetical protein
METPMAFPESVTCKKNNHKWRNIILHHVSAQVVVGSMQEPPDRFPAGFTPSPKTPNGTELSTRSEGSISPRHMPPQPK